MANKTIPELDAASTFSATDQFPVSQGGNPAVAGTLSQLGTLFPALDADGKIRTILKLYDSATGLYYDLCIATVEGVRLVTLADAGQA
jgi:hypothetical protein